MSDVIFLSEYQPLEFQILNEGTDGSKKYKIVGIVSRADVPNKNKRIYPRGVLEEAVKNVKSSALKGGFVGELDHPTSPKINIERISHKITKIDMMEDGAVVAEMEVLDTPHGRILKQLINEGVHLGVSTRALGKVRPHTGHLGEGLLEVSSGLSIKAIDIVFEPSAGNDGRPSFFAESIEDFYAIENFQKKTLNDLVEDIF